MSMNVWLDNCLSVSECPDTCIERDRYVKAYRSSWLSCRARPGAAAKHIFVHSAVFFSRVSSTFALVRKLPSFSSCSSRLLALSLFLSLSLVSLSFACQRTADKLEDLQKEIAEQKQKLKRACHHHRKLRKTCQGKGLLPPSKILSSPAKDGRERTAREGREQRGSSGPGIGFDPATQSNIEMEPHLESLKNHFQTLLYCIG